MVRPEMVTVLPLLTVKIRNAEAAGSRFTVSAFAPGPRIFMLLSSAGKRAERVHRDRAGDGEIDHVIGSAGIGCGDRFAQTAIAVASAVVRIGGFGHDQRRIDVARLALERADVGAVAAAGVRNRAVIYGARKPALIDCAASRGLLPLSMAGLPVSRIMRRGRATVVGERAEHRSRVDLIARPARNPPPSSLLKL